VDKIIVYFSTNIGKNPSFAVHQRKSNDLNNLMLYFWIKNDVPENRRVFVAKDTYVYGRFKTEIYVQDEKNFIAFLWKLKGEYEIANEYKISWEHKTRLNAYLIEITGVTKRKQTA
jgi:hypothetical protein